MPDYKKSEHSHELAEGILWDHRSELLLFVDIISKNYSGWILIHLKLWMNIFLMNT